MNLKIGGMSFFGILLYSFSLSAQTIQSVPGGGNWDDTLTWVGYKIPGASNNVVIYGTVSVRGSSTCHDLTIMPDAILQNGGGLGWVTPIITGNMINNGTIRNNPSANALWLEIHGDITNNGTWTPTNTYFASLQSQSISQSTGKEFCGAFTKKSAAGVSDTFPLVAASDLTINASRFDCNGYHDGKYYWGKINMASHNLLLKGGTPFTGATISSMNLLTCQDSSTVYSLTIDSDVKLCGRVTLTDSKVYFNGNTTVTDTLQNGGSLGWVTPQFKGKLINNNLIRNNPKGNQLWLDLYGDCVNNGIWTPTNTYFASRQSQAISQSTGKEFCGAFIKKDAAGVSDTFPLVAASDLIFNASRFDCNGYHGGNYYWGKLNMAGHNLLLKGGTPFTGATTSNMNLFTCHDSATIYSLTIDSDVKLCGRVTLTDSKVYFNGNTTITDTLQNGGSLGWVTPQFKGKLINNNLIRNNPKGNQLWLDLYGDCVNNGIWTPTNTYFASRQSQAISQSTGKEFCGAFIKKDATGVSDTFPLVAASDLTFNASRFECNGYHGGKYYWGNLNMANHTLLLKGSTSFTGTILSNVDTFTCNDSATVNSISVEGNTRLCGKFTVTDSKVSFNNEITVIDTLQNGGNLGWITLYLNGGLTNKGLIRNNPKGNALWTEIRRNITNTGTWTNTKNALIDTLNQTIGLENGKTIASPFSFDALWTSGPYQWLHGGEKQVGTSRNLPFDSLTLAVAGVYQCKKNDSLSRTITIKNGSASMPIAGPDIIVASAVFPFGWNITTGNQISLNIQTPIACKYQVAIYDLRGQRLIYHDGIAAAGRQVFPITTRRLRPGSYIIQFRTNEIRDVKQIMLTGK